MSESKQRASQQFNWKNVPILTKVIRLIELFGLEVLPLYMMTDREKILVGSITVILLVLLLIAVVVYLPGHLISMLERLYYYTTGSPIPIFRQHSSKVLI